MAEYTQLLDVNGTTVTLSNSTSEATLYTYTVPGGTLADYNTLRLQVQAVYSLAGDNNNLALSMQYAGETAGTISIGTVGKSDSSLSEALVLEGLLSGSGNPTIQIGAVSAVVGLSMSQFSGNLAGYQAVGVNSAGNQTLKIIAKFDTADANNSITFYHGTLEYLNYITNDPTPDLDEPTLQLWSACRLNSLNWETRKDIVFYAPLEYDLVFMGYDSCTFTRTGITTATWRDGGSHQVDEDKPRFEYTGETISGLAINPSLEHLSFSSSNVLSNSSTLIWIQDQEIKSTLTESNPFNSSGVYVGITPGAVHIKQIVKFNRVATSSEVITIGTLLL